jgi:hypothetical protein
MPTTVANLLRGDHYDVYIGRAGHGHDGYFGNPVHRNRRCPVCGATHYERGDTIACFERYFLERLTRDPEYRRRIIELKGKRLGCFCNPRPCHGDVIARWIDELW